MPSLPKHRLFQRSDRIAEGWYWALPSSALRKGQVRPLRIQGKALAVFRGADGKVVALDAYCPHLGAHLGHGQVEGNGLRCGLHRWKFDADGRCVDVPCQQRAAAVATGNHPVEERFGLIWVYTGPIPRRPPPFIPELQNEDVVTTSGTLFRLRCHPHALLAHAVDAQALHVAGRLAPEEEFTVRSLDEGCQLFTAAPPPKRYSLCAWNGATFTLSFGPEARRLHLLFATRLGEGGGTEGTVLAVSKFRAGLRGRLFTWLMLLLAGVFQRAFLRRAGALLATQRFAIKAPVRGDRALVELAQHLDRQSPSRWGYGEVEPEPIQVETTLPRSLRPVRPGLRN